MKSGNKGQFDHLKGLPKQQPTTPKPEDQGTKSVLGKHSHLEGKEDAEEGEGDDGVIHQHDMNEATRASKRQKTTAQEGSRSNVKGKAQGTRYNQSQRTQAATTNNEYSPFQEFMPGASGFNDNLVGHGEHIKGPDRHFDPLVYNARRAANTGYGGGNVFNEVPVDPADAYHLVNQPSADVIRQHTQTNGVLQQPSAGAYHQLPRTAAGFARGRGRTVGIDRTSQPTTGPQHPISQTAQEFAGQRGQPFAEHEAFGRSGGAHYSEPQAAGMHFGHTSGFEEPAQTSRVVRQQGPQVAGISTSQQYTPFSIESTDQPQMGSSHPGRPAIERCDGQEDDTFNFFEEDAQFSRGAHRQEPQVSGSFVGQYYLPVGVAHGTFQPSTGHYNLGPRATGIQAGQQDSVHINRTIGHTARARHPGLPAVGGYGKSEDRTLGGNGAYEHLTEGRYREPRAGVVHRRTQASMHATTSPAVCTPPVGYTPPAGYAPYPTINSKTPTSRRSTSSASFTRSARTTAANSALPTGHSYQAPGFGRDLEPWTNPVLRHGSIDPFMGAHTQAMGTSIECQRGRDLNSTASAQANLIGEGIEQEPFDSDLLTNIALTDEELLELLGRAPPEFLATAIGDRGSEFLAQNSAAAAEYEYPDPATGMSPSFENVGPYSRKGTAETLP